MNHSGHVMLVGEGAERFAVARGMKRENLLTDETRKVWLLWKEAHSDWWGPGVSSPNWRDRFKNRSADERLEFHERLQRIAEDLGIDPAVRSAAIHKIVYPPTGTIHCSRSPRRFSDHRRRLLYGSGCRFRRCNGQR